MRLIDVANELGINATYLSDIENGKMVKGESDDRNNK